MKWHGYILVEQPTALDSKAWPDVMGALGARWNTTPDNPEWCKRLAVRYSLDGTKAIIESNFDVADLDPADETRMAAVAAEASRGAMTAKAAAQMFLGKVTVFAGETQAESASACREYLAKNAAEWEEPMEGTSTIDKIVDVVSKALKRIVTPENKWSERGIA